MAEKKAANKTYTTPKGIAVFPWVNKPDTKFNPEGTYSIKLKLPTDDAKTQELIALIDKAMADAAAEAKKENPKKQIKSADAPYKPEYDDNGDETGNTLFTFKLKAKVKSKSGEVFSQRPKLFDAKGKAVTANLGGGSIVKVAFAIAPFYAPTLGAGVTLRLYAVQIIDLKTYGEKSADAYGFGEEEGYEGGSEGQAEDDVPQGVEGDGNGDF